MNRQVEAHGWRLPVILAALIAIPNACSSFAEAAVIYVNSQAVGANDGTSWTDAFSDLQSALAASDPGDEIWVAAGTYSPGPPGDALTSFVLRDGVALYGGFAGTESSREQRNWIVNQTVLSGDVGHDDVYGNPWYVGWDIGSANSGHVVVGSGVGGTAILDGFHVTAGATGPTGTPAGHPLMHGSGLYIVGGSPTIRHCTFSRNVAAFDAGGAVYCEDASPIIVDCSFTQNWVHLGNGAGIAIVGNAAPAVSDCVFSENHVVCHDGNTGQGAGISIQFLTVPLSVTITRCRFIGNVAETYYPFGGIDIARGGGINNAGAVLTMRDCVFRQNSANAGAGIQTWSPATLINCTFDHNVVYAHQFSTTTDGGYGAGVCIYSFQPYIATLVNCSIVNNTGAEGVGVQSLVSAECAVRNSIIWGNIATGEDVAPIDAQIKGSFSARYSCIQNLLTPIPGEDPPDPANYPGCIVTDPQFINAAAGDLHLAARSPVIDAGRNDDVPPGVTADLDGRPRFVDDPAVVDTGAGSPPIVDMGAFERTPSILGDVDCDGDLDAADASALAAVLLEVDAEPCHVSSADVNGDAARNGSDVQALVNALFGP